MKNYYLPLTQWVWRVVFWTVLLSQTTWAQSVPDSQFARLGTTLAITTNGGFVTTEIISNPTIGPTRSGSNVIKYSVQGDRRWQTGFLEGGFFIGGRIPGYNYEVIQASLIAPTTDGGVAVVGRTSLRGEEVVTRISATGAPRRWEESDLFQFPDGISFDDLIGTPDGGFLLLATRATFGGKTTVYLRKYNADVSVAWTKEIAYPTPNPATPDRSLTKGEAIINTSDGGYLVAGYFNRSGTNTPEVGWVAKLNADGNVAWQKLLDIFPVALNANGPLPKSIGSMRSVTSLLTSADGTGYALAGTGLVFSFGGSQPPATAILELDADGSFRRARAIDDVDTDAFITLYTGSGGKKYYAVGNSSFQSGVDPQILLVDPATKRPDDPDLLKAVAKRTFNGPDDGRLVAIGVAGDGGLVFASSGNQVVKLAPETTTPPPTGTLALTQPTYNCQTGAITFNTTGGDGSPITYNAPGVMRSSATSNTGTVEPGLRGDPKPILITATQSGQTVSYTFDFGAFCSGTPPPVNPPNPPTPPTPPTGGALTLTQPTYNCQTGAITFNTTGGDGSTITYNAPGISRSSATSNSGTVEPGLRGDPKPIPITATQNGQTVSYTFDFGAFCSGTPPPVNPPTPPTPPTGGALTLLAPTYDCASGAFTFRTSGGNGSTIEYMAIGITGWTTNPNQFVDKDSRTANDVKPFTLMARQNGVVVNYVWDLKAACGRSQARLGAGERESELRVLVLGNPVRDVVTVEIRGAEDQPLMLRLVDLRGRLVESRLVKQAGVAEQQIFDVAQQGPGLLLLRVGTGTQSKMVKILKQ